MKINHLPVVVLFCLSLAIPSVSNTAWAQDDTQDKSQTEAKAADPTMPELRTKLLAAVEKDQAARFKIIEAMKNSASGQIDPKIAGEIAKIDEENTAWLSEVIKEHGWPDKTEVGVDGAHAAWLLVQHADRKPEFQKSCLELMKAEPKGEVAGQDIAYLTDRVLCAENKPQLYGTQLTQVDGKMVPKPIEDEENVDERRASVGLGTLEEYIKMVERMYAGQGQNDAADKQDAGNSDADKTNDDKQNNDKHFDAGGGLLP